MADVAHRALRVTAPAEDDGLDDPARHLPDDRLRLLFTCCHPAIAGDAQVALALRWISGLSTESTPPWRARWSTGLAAVDALAADATLRGSVALHAARADLLRRLGRTEDAARAYDAAIAATRNEAERRFLQRRRA